MTVPFCNGCGAVQLTPEFDSDAHIIPNALGGRLSPSGLICRECNTLLDRLADNPLIKAFGPWPTLIDVPRHRGENAPVIIEAADGQCFRVEANGTASLAEVVYDTEPVEGGLKVSLGANNWKIVKQLINRAKKDCPQLDVEQAVAHAKKVTIPPNSPWRIQTNFAPQHVFPAAFVAFWLFFLHKTGQRLAPWPRVLEVINGLQTDGTFRYLPEGLPGLLGPDIPVSHKIVLRTVPATGQLIGYIEILGTLRIGGLLAQGAPGLQLEHIYVADVFGKSNRSGEYSIDGATFDAVAWKTLGLGRSEKDLVGSLEKAQAPLQAYWEARQKTMSS